MRSSAKEAATGYIFLLPNFLGFLVFTLVPVALSLVLSLVDWDMLSVPKFVGPANFIKLLGFHKEALGWAANDPLFMKDIEEVETDFRHADGETARGIDR